MEKVKRAGDGVGRRGKRKARDVKEEGDGGKRREEVKRKVMEKTEKVEVKRECGGEKRGRSG